LQAPEYLRLPLVLVAQQAAQEHNPLPGVALWELRTAWPLVEDHKEELSIQVAEALLDSLLVQISDFMEGILASSTCKTLEVAVAAWLHR
jgi:hypothetical protein